MGGIRKKKKKTPEETPIIDPDFPPPMDATSGGSAAEGIGDMNATSGGSAAEGIMDATSGGSASEGIGDMDATSGGSAAESIDDLLGKIGDENSPLIPDPIGEGADEKALENEAKLSAIEKGKGGGGRGKAMSAAAAKKKAQKEKKQANKVAAYKAESAAKEQKEKIKRQRTIASQQNKTARERILRGETGARGRMFNRINAKFQIPDAPVNFPRIGGSGTQYN